MKALLLLVYALGAPIGVGCLLFVLWRLEEGLLGPPSPRFPFPVEDRLNPTALDESVTVAQPPLVGVAGTPDRQEPVGLLQHFRIDPQQLDSDGYHLYLQAEYDPGLNGYEPQPKPSGYLQPAAYSDQIDQDRDPQPSTS